MHKSITMEYYVGQTENNLDMHFDDERPPIYNAEDYAAHLRKYSRWTEHTLYTKKHEQFSIRLTGTQLYSNVNRQQSQNRTPEKKGHRTG